MTPSVAPDSDPDSDAEDVELNTYPARAARAYASAYADADPAGIEAMISVSHANSAVAAATGRWCDALGVNRTMGRYQVLRILFFTPEHRQTQIEIANEIQVTSANVTFLVDGLEKDELVRRVPSRTDRRTVFVELTPSGLELAQRLVPSLAHFFTNLAVGFTAEEKLLLARLLEKVRVNAEHYEAHELD